MTAVTFAASILPGKEEEWRRLVQEVAEERLDEYEALRRRLGISNESVWLARARDGVETAVVYLEAEDPGRIAPALAASEDPFDLWFKERFVDCHGPNLKRAAAGLIFAYPSTTGDGHRSGVTRR